MKEMMIFVIWPSSIFLSYLPPNIPICSTLSSTDITLFNPLFSLMNIFFNLPSDKSLSNCPREFYLLLCIYCFLCKYSMLEWFPSPLFICCFLWSSRLWKLLGMSVFPNFSTNAFCILSNSIGCRCLLILSRLQCDPHWRRVGYEYYIYIRCSYTY